MIQKVDIHIQASMVSILWIITKSIIKLVTPMMEEVYGGMVIHIILGELARQIRKDFQNLLLNWKKVDIAF